MNRNPFLALVTNIFKFSYVIMQTSYVEYSFHNIMVNSFLTCQKCTLNKLYLELSKYINIHKEEIPFRGRFVLERFCVLL